MESQLISDQTFMMASELKKRNELENLFQRKEVLQVKELERVAIQDLGLDTEKGVA